MKSEFENSIKRSSSYEKLVYQHGERLFIFDDGKYKIAAVQLAWEIFKEKQTEVDELTLQVAEMKSRLNDAYTDGQSAMYTARQSKVDELQRRNQMLNDNIKEQDQKLVYQNEVIETQAEKLLGLRDEKAELQKRVDKAIYLLASLKAENDLWGCDQVERQIELLEQALKGGAQ